MSTTINKEEIQKFSKLAEEWWDVNGKFKPLHMFNPIRIEYITENIKKHFKIKIDKANFLEGLKILDIVKNLIKNSSIDDLNKHIENEILRVNVEIKSLE